MSAIKNGSRLSSGIIDISSYLNSLLPPEQKALPGDQTNIPGCICLFIRGDANRDGKVDLADYVTILNYLFNGGDDPINMDSYDADDNGILNIADGAYICSYLYSGGDDPPPPFSDWGTDQTYDLMELPCQDLGDFEHARNSMETGKIPIPPGESPSNEIGILPSNPTESIDGTGGFGDIAPGLEFFSGPGGLGWGVVPSYRTRYVLRDDHTSSFDFQSEFGVNWFSGIPHIIDLGEDETTRFWVRWSASCVRAYDGSAGSPYYGKYLNSTKLDPDPGSEVLTLYGLDSNSFHYLLLYDISGKVYVFYGYNPECRKLKGRLYKIISTGENEVVLNWELSSGKLISVDVKNEGVACQTWEYTYGTSGASKDHIIEVKMDRYVDEPASEAKEFDVKFRYFGDGFSNETSGSTGDLMQIDVTKSLTPYSESDNKITRSYYYNYFTEDFNTDSNPGFHHQVKTTWGPDKCQYFEADGENGYKWGPDNGSTSLIDVSDRAYSYYADRRVKTIQFRSASCCGGGQAGVYSYNWYLGTTQGIDEPDAEHMLVAVTEPVCPCINSENIDGVKNYVVYNPYGQITLQGKKVEVSGESANKFWLNKAAYQPSGSTKWLLKDLWFPAAIDLSVNNPPPIDESDLLAWQNTQTSTFGDSRTLTQVELKSAEGKHRQLVYTWNGYGTDLHVEERYGEGETGSTYSTHIFKYAMRADTDDPLRAIYLAAWVKNYYSDISSTKTDFNYTFYDETGNSLAVKELKTIRPAIPQSQGGSGNNVETFQIYSKSGFLVWRKDGRGYIHFSNYNPITFKESVSVEAIDVANPPPNVTLPEDVPCPWSSPGTGNVNAATFYKYDGLGRVTFVDSEAGLSDGNTDRRRYSYSIYTKLTGNSSWLSPDQPVVLSYPHVGSPSEPGRGEAVEWGEVSITSSTPGGKSLSSANGYPVLSTDINNFYDDDWLPTQSSVATAFKGTLVGYSGNEYDKVTGKIISLKNWDADHTTTYSYDSCGRLARIEGPATQEGLHSITRQKYDALGRVIEQWIGTCDNGWTDPEGSGSGDDMTRVGKSYYDNSDDNDILVVGNGNLTLAENFGSDNSGDVRKTRYEYDGQDRQVKVYRGYSSGNQADLISVTEYKGHVIDWVLSTEEYKGTFVSTNRVSRNYSLYDKFGNVYCSYIYGVDSNGGLTGSSKTRYVRDDNGQTIKVENQDQTFRKSVYDGAGRVVDSYLSYDVDESFSNYGAAQTVAGDTIIEKSHSVYDKSGQATLQVSYEVNAEGNDLAPVNISANWSDMMGRVIKSADYGNNNGSVPSTRPDNTTDARVTEYFYGATLINGNHRWSYVIMPDGQVTGREINCIGETVNKWIKSNDSDDFKVTTFTYDSPGHTVKKTIYQDYLTSGSLPPEWTSGNLSVAKPSSTGFIYGITKSDTGKVWEKNKISSPDYLREVRPPDTTSGEPVGSDSWRQKFAYNAYGEVIGSGLYVKDDGSTKKRTGRSFEYDNFGRKIEDRVTDFVGNENDSARVLRWEYDCLGRLLSAKTLDNEDQVMNEIKYEYDSYGAVIKVWEEHEGEVNSSTSDSTLYTYEGPGFNSVYGHDIDHRLTGYTINDIGVQAQTVKMSYGEGQSVSNMLGRVERNSWEYNNKDYFCEERFLGRGRWQKSDYYRDYAGDIWHDNDHKHSLTQEITTRNRFGQPMIYNCNQYYKPTGQHIALDLKRTITYNNYKISDISDDIVEQHWSSGLGKKRAYTYTGFGETDSYELDTNETPVLNRDWSRDAAGNWTDFSDDFIDDYDRTRCYNRRNEIYKIDEDPTCDGISQNPPRVEYDKAGRIVTHNHELHGVNATFEYDSWGRLFLVDEQKTGGVQNYYHYDALGHLINKTSSILSWNYSYGNGSRILWHEQNNSQQQLLGTVFYIRSSESGRLLANLDPKHGCFWYILDALNEIEGICAFEDEDLGGSQIQFYYYSPTGELDEKFDSGSGNYNSIIYGGAPYGGESLWEDEFKGSVLVGAGKIIYHKIGMQQQYENISSRKKTKLRYVDTSSGNSSVEDEYDKIAKDAEEKFIVDNEWDKYSTTEKDILNFGTSNANLFVFIGDTTFNEQKPDQYWSLHKKTTRMDLAKFNVNLMVVCGCSGWNVFAKEIDEHNVKGLEHIGKSLVVCGPSWKNTNIIWRKAHSKKKHFILHNSLAVKKSCKTFLFSLWKGLTINESSINANIEISDEYNKNIGNYQNGVTREPIWKCTYKNKKKLNEKSTLNDVLSLKNKF